MKKGMTIGLATLLAVGSISPAVLAAKVENTPEVLLAASKKKDEEKDERIVERATVESLTLEEAIRYGLNSDYSLMELEYTIKQLKTREDQVEDQYDSLESSLETLNRQRDELKKKIDETSKDTVTVDLQNEMTSLVTSLDSLRIDLPATPQAPAPDPDPEVRLNQQIIYLRDFLASISQYITEYEKYHELQDNKDKLNQIMANIIQYQATLDTLENSLDEIDLQQTSVFNNRVQMRESMEVTISSKYLALLMTQDQIDFMKHSLEVQHSQINATKTRYELGLVSKKDYEKATREITDLEIKIAQTEKQLKNDKRVFALSIGVTYNDDLTLVRPEIEELPFIEQKKATEELVKNSYNMVNARTQLRIKEDDLDNIDDVPNRTKETKELAEIEVDIAKLNIEKLEVDLEKAVNNVFYQVNQQYQAMKDAELDLEEAKTDNADLQLYYDLGLVSKLEFEAANTSVKQAELNYNNAKYQYYLVTKQAELMEAGVIPTN